MAKLSIITPTVRKEGLALIEQSLTNQTFTDYEWLIGSPFDPEIENAVWVKDDFEGGFWSLNRIYNRLFQQAKSDIIVSWQDWIWIPPNGLEKFWINYQKVKAPITGVGDQYQSLDEYGKPVHKVWDDPRKTSEYGSFYECFPDDCEFNWCILPKQLVYKVGGMDEQLDFLGYGGDQLQMVERMGEMGIKFYIDQTNESFTVRHGRTDGWEKNHVLKNGTYEKRKQELIAQKKWPILDYLS
jgi:hypothetical protein